MIISIFKNLELAIWVDYSGHPDCISVQDINFNPETEVLEVLKEWDEVVVNVVEKPLPPETTEEQKSRIIASILSAEDLSMVDLEWITFSDLEAGDIIVRKVFSGNPYAQTSLLRKVAKIQEARLSGMEITPEMQATLDYANTKDQEIETLLTFFYQ